jgi:hypothetical protein
VPECERAAPGAHRCAVPDPPQAAPPADPAVGDAIIAAVARAPGAEAFGSASISRADRDCVSVGRLATAVGITIAIAVRITVAIPLADSDSDSASLHLSGARLISEIKQRGVASAAVDCDDGLHSRSVAGRARALGGCGDKPG